MDIRPGDTIYGSTRQDSYEVVGPIGRGGFGIVYEIQDVKNNRFALKTITTIYLDKDDLKALANEGQLAPQVEGENIVKVFYFHDGTQYTQFPPYMIMEYADGGSLDLVIKRAASDDKQFSHDELRSFFTQLAHGMNSVNIRLIHRDIKPANILIDKNVLKISDFGLSKVVGASTRSASFKGIQDIRYKAPEAWKMEANTAAMDMYSMGIVFYELATLRHPYKLGYEADFEEWKSAHFTRLPEDPRKFNPNLGIGLAQLILKMMSKRADERYSSWIHVLERIEMPAPSELKRKVEVGPLVEHALQKQRSAEQRRLAEQETATRQREERAIVHHCFTEVIEAASLVINEFNSQSENEKLQLDQQGDLSFGISRKNHMRSRAVICTLNTPHQDKRLDGNKILAWGIVEAPSGRGFNILLVKNAGETIYGKWETLHAEHNPLAHQKDSVEPFAFQFAQLDREIDLLNTLHVYQTKRGILSPELFIPLIKEIL